MKKHVIFGMILALLVLLAGCQTMEAIPDSENTYAQVYEFPGMHKSDIYTIANDWMVSTFRSAEAVIEYADKDEGIVTGKCIASVPVGGILPASIRFKLTINVKEEKVRVKMDSMKFAESGDAFVDSFSKFTRDHYNKFVSWADVEIGPSLQAAIKQGAADTW